MLNRGLRMSDIPDGLGYTMFLAEKLSAYDQDLGWMSGTRSSLRNTGHPINAERARVRGPASEASSVSSTYVGEASQAITRGEPSSAWRRGSPIPQPLDRSGGPPANGSQGRRSNSERMANRSTGRRVAARGFTHADAHVHAHGQAPRRRNVSASGTQVGKPKPFAL